MNTSRQADLPPLGASLIPFKTALLRAQISRSTYVRMLRGGTIQDTQYRDRNGWRVFTETEVEHLMAVTLRVNDTRSARKGPLAFKTAQGDGKP